MPPDGIRPPERRPRLSRRRLIRIAVVSGLIVAAVATTVILLNRGDGPGSSLTGGPSAFQTSAPTQKTARQYCSLAGKSLICQDIRSGKAKKYALPAHIGVASRILPSPDEKYFFVQTPANPLPTSVPQLEGSHHGSPMPSKPADLLYIVDSKFQIVKKLPADGGTYLDFDWTADSKGLVYGKRDDKTQKSGLYAYDVGSGESRTIQADIDIASFFVTADGSHVLISDEKSAKDGALGLTAVSLTDGKRQAIDTGGLKEQMQYYANMTYDRIHDRLYVVGSTEDGPVITVARPVAGGTIGVEVLLRIRDGYAYTPLTAVDDGMFVFRKQDATQEYGLLTADNKFTKMDVKPTQLARFGAHTLPSLDASASAAADASDYVYGYVAAPKRLQDYLVTEAAKGCPAGEFSVVELLAAEADQQAAVQYADCKGGAKTRYYVAEGSGYKMVAETITLLPCDVVSKYSLSKTVVPICGRL